MARLSPSGRRSSLCLAASCALALTLAATPTMTLAQSTERAASDRANGVAVQSIDIFIADAAARFGIPEHWICVVMQAESAGDPRAVSSAGAMGLMQVMPGTWRELRTQHGFGTDPFDQRDNILAGAAYLRAMYDRFGSPGFLAAYNAGPRRYAEHLRTGRPLPSETRTYLARLAPLIGSAATVPMQPSDINLAVDWRNAPLFTSNLSSEPSVDSTDREAPTTLPSSAPSPGEINNDPPSSDGLFVPSQPEGSE